MALRNDKSLRRPDSHHSPVLKHRSDSRADGCAGHRVGSDGREAGSLAEFVFGNQFVAFVEQLASRDRPIWTNHSRALEFSGGVEYAILLAIRRYLAEFSDDERADKLSDRIRAFGIESFDGTARWLRSYLSESGDELLEHCRQAFRAGGGVAIVHDAFMICEFLSLPLPRWLAREIGNVLNDAFLGLPGQTGRTANAYSKNRADMAHAARYCAVMWVRDAQEEWRRSGSQTLLPEYPDPGRTLDDAFRLASLLLAESPSFGSESAIRHSYRMVVRALVKDPARFHIPMLV